MGMHINRPLLGIPQKYAYFGMVASLASMLSAADVSITVSTTTDVVNAIDGVVSLREAINQANTLDGDDVTIVIPAGVYNISGGGPYGHIHVPTIVAGPDLMKLRGAGIDKTIISGDNTNRLFNFSSGNYTLERMTLQNGYYEASQSSSGSGAGSSAYGAGLYFDELSHVVLNDLRITNCHAVGGLGEDGPDIMTTGGPITAENGGPGGEALGGGIFVNNNDGSFTANNLRIDNCRATGGPGGAGGNITEVRAGAVGGNGGVGGDAYGGGLAIWAYGSVTLDNVVIENNSANGGLAGAGGGIVGGYSSAAAIAPGVGGAAGHAFGGGLYTHGFSNVESGFVIELSNTDILGNTAQGGIGAKGGKWEESYSTGVTGGAGGTGGVALGGGLYVSEPQLFIFESGSVAGNRANGGLGGAGGAGGGGYVDGGVTAGLGAMGGNGFGAGMYVKNDFSSTAVQIGAIQFSNNTARGGDGGVGGDASYGTYASALFAPSGGPGGNASGGAFWILNNGRYTEVNDGPVITSTSIISGSGGAPGDIHLNGGSPGLVLVGSNGASGTATDPAARNLPSVYTEIRGKAWKDTGGVTASFDGTDTLLPNILVSLIDDNGRMLGRTYTDLAGTYSFNSGYSGDALLRFGLNGSTLTPVLKDQGGDDSLDSDIDATGDTLLITITAGVDELDVDAGFDVINSAPRLKNLTLTISGSVSNDIIEVKMLANTAVPLDGDYVLTVSLPVGTEFVDLISTDGSGNTATRRIYIDTLIMGGG